MKANDNALWRALAAAASRQFLVRHDLFDAGYESVIEKLLQGCPIIRISHQPNFFAALNIVGLLVWAEKLAQEINGVVVFVGVDYDVANDQRFRSALLPPIADSRPVHVSPLRRTFRGRVAYAAPAPIEQELEATMRLLSQCIHLSGKRFSLLPQSTGLQRAMYEQLQYVESFSDFNMAYMEWCSRQLCTTRSLFVPASSYICGLNSEINRLIRMVLEADGAPPHKLLWRVCPNCLQRVVGTVASSEVLKVYWHCETCGIDKTEVLDWSMKLGAQADKPAFIPQVLLCDLIDLHIVRSDVSVSYGSSAVHLVNATKVYKKVFRTSPKTKEFTWTPRDMQFVPPDAPLYDAWSRGRFSMPVYLSLFNKQKIINEVLRVPIEPLRTQAQGDIGRVACRRE